MRTPLAIVLALVALLAAAPAAQADAEPNNGITQAEGPLKGAETHSGVLSTADDVDWYAFYVSGQVQMDISLTVPGDSPGYGIDGSFKTSDGRSIGSFEADRNETSHYTYTTPPGQTRYLLAFDHDCCSNPAGATYQFRIDTTPAGAVVDGPGNSPVTATGEPNETAAQAFGPLNGGVTYGGSIETTNDVDWFTFYSSGTTPFDLAMTNPRSSGCEPDGDLTIGTGDDYDSRVGSVSPSSNSTEHIVYTPKRSEQYFLRVSGDCVGATYQFRVDPPSALAPSIVAPPPPPVATPAPAATPSPCDEALTTQRYWRSKVTKLKARKLRAHSRAKRRKLSRRLKTAKKRLRSANRLVASAC